MTSATPQGRWTPIETFQYSAVPKPGARATPSTSPTASDDETVDALVGLAALAGAAWVAWKVGKKVFGSAAPSAAPAPAGLDVVEATAAKVELTAYDLGCFTFTFDSSVDLWPLAGTPELQDAIEAAVYPALPDGMEFAAVLSRGSLKVTILTWFRDSWDGVTGTRVEGKKRSGTVDTVTLGERLRKALAHHVKHPVETVLKVSGVVRAAKALKGAFDWFTGLFDDAPVPGGGGGLRHPLLFVLLFGS